MKSCLKRLTPRYVPMAERSMSIDFDSVELLGVKAQSLFGASHGKADKNQV